MKSSLSPEISLVLSESLSLYWRIVKSKWPSLLAVAASCQLLLTAFRHAMQRFCEMDGMDAVLLEGLEGVVVCQTLGLVAVVIAVDCAVRLLSGGRSPEAGGIAAAWRRALATSLLWMIVVSACGIAAYYANSAIMPASVLALKAIGLDATSNATSRYLAALAPAGLLFATIVFFAWLLTQWLFSVPFSIILPLAGTSAMSASSKLVKRNFRWSLEAAAGAYLVPVGIAAVPVLFGVVFARDALPGPHPFIESKAMCEAVIFGAGLIQMIVFPFCYVAGLMYIRHTEGSSAIKKESKADRARLLLWLLLVIGAPIFTYSVGQIKCTAKEIREGATFRSFFVAADAEVIHDISPECRFAEKLREENGKFFVDSPFDLRIGSTEYARQLGEDCVCVYLSKPYHGFDSATLTFAKSDKRLAYINVSKGFIAWHDKSAQMSMAECRAEVAAIAADMCARLGIPPDAMKITDEGDEDALAYVKSNQNRESNFGRALHFYCREAKLRIDGQIVSYQVNGLIHANTGMCSVEIFIRLERPRAVK